MKGQQKIKHGSSFKCVLSYLFDHDEPEFIAGTIPEGSITEMTREFVALSSTRKDIYKPVWHNSLRLPEGEHLSADKWSDIATDYAAEMGLMDSQYVVIKHNNSDGEHIHIVANRVLPDGTIHNSSHESMKSTRIISKIEKKHGLTITKSFDDDAGMIAKPKKNEIEKAIRTGQSPTRLLIQRVIDEALNDNPDFHDFTERLFIAGVTVKPNIASTGRVNGLSFDLDGITFSGSKLGKKYAWNQLIKQVSYSPERDNSLLQKLKEVAQKNDEIRSSQTTSRDAISINAKAREDCERTSISHDGHNKSAKTGLVSTQNGRANVSAQPRQDKPKVKQIKRNAGDHFSVSSNNDNSDHIHLNKGVFTMPNETEIKRKKRQRKQELLIITGKKRNDLDSEKFAEEQKKFLKTLELAFEKRENGWYSKHNGKLAFTEMDDKIVGGEGLMNKDGTYNEAAMKAMKQAAQLKFGDTFESIGSAEYVRESWFSTAKIGCFNTGYEPEPDDFDRLIDELKRHEEKYGKPLYLHPGISKQLNDHKRQLEYTKRHMRTASGGNSDAEIKTEQERLLNQKQSATVNIGTMVDRFRNKPEHLNNHENQSKRGFEK